MVNSCQVPCVRERQKFAPGSSSPNPIADNEILCRALFADDYNADPKPRDGLKYVKASTISKQQLLNGQVSVWRIAIVEDFGIAQAEEETKATGRANALGGVKAMCQFSAHEVRALTVMDTDKSHYRAISVLDDTRTDNVGGEHRCHAHLALCASLAGDVEKQQLFLNSAKEQLRLLIQQKLPLELRRPAAQ